MSANADLTCCRDIITKACATSDSNMGDDDAMLSKNNVMPDLHLIVDFGSSTNPRTAKPCAVDGSTSTNLNIIIKLNNADLLDLHMPSLGKFVTKSI